MFKSTWKKNPPKMSTFLTHLNNIVDIDYDFWGSIFQLFPLCYVNNIIKVGQKTNDKWTFLKDFFPRGFEHEGSKTIG